MWEWVHSTTQFISGAGRLLPFWGLFALLAGLEVFLPAVQHPAERGQRWPTNIGLSLVVTALLSLAPFSVLVAAEWAHRTNTGLLNSVDPPWLSAALATIAIYS